MTASMDSKTMNNACLFFVVVLVVISVLFSAAVRTLSLYAHRKQYGSFPNESTLHEFECEPLM